MNDAQLTWSDQVTVVLARLRRAAAETMARVATLENENAELRDALFDLEARVTRVHEEALREVTRLANRLRP